MEHNMYKAQKLSKRSQTQKRTYWIISFTFTPSQRIHGLLAEANFES